VSGSAALAEALRLVVILDTAVARGRDLAALAGLAAEGGATMLQVRAKSAPAAHVAALTRAVRAAAPHLPVIVNDRLDVALAAGATGCHLGQDDFPIDAALTIVPAGFWLGGSAGTPEEARRAAAAGAHYLGIGPIRTTGSKADAGSAIGVAGFKAVHAAAPGIPAVAIGGVNHELVADLRAAGAAGIAVIGAVLEAADPLAATRDLRAAVGA
jgi:thiamine-phosphate pyrophosphorylase